MQALTAFAAVDTVGTVALMVSMVNHSDKIPVEYQLPVFGGFAMFACVPPLLLASLHWIRTRLVTSVTESRVTEPQSNGGSGRCGVTTTITLGFAALVPGGVGSQRSFGLRELRTEYDGGIAYLFVSDEEGAKASGLPTSYVLDPIEMANVWTDEDKARVLLDAMNRLGDE